MKDFPFIILINSVAVVALAELLVAILMINSTELPPWTAITIVVFSINVFFKVKSQSGLAITRYRQIYHLSLTFIHPLRIIFVYLQVKFKTGLVIRIMDTQ
ncbi:uncharacterized protein LOC115987913 [Quercus lobata]|uniref:uncharacterized protein LOC115987913 n=1 Tax=Quercus lobata TaxID=97700 RepID=UPI001243EE35|nr:uncharacterized protein LOC115987913 [Quercus lobata]